MESARNRVTMEVVDAEDLWLLPAVDKYGYICRGCDLTVYPASYLKTNLQRPHFRSPHGQEHLEGCDIEGDEKTVASGKRALCGASYRQVPPCHRHGWSLGMSDRLSIPLLSPSPSGASRSVRTGSSGNGEARPQGRRSAQSIRRICRAFINFPYDRDLSLEVPGVEATTYQQVFKKLRGEGVEDLPSQKIFYGELQLGQG